MLKTFMLKKFNCGRQHKTNLFFNNYDKCYHTVFTEKIRIFNIMSELFITGIY